MDNVETIKSLTFLEDRSYSCNGGEKPKSRDREIGVLLLQEKDEKIAKKCSLAYPSTRRP